MCIDTRLRTTVYGFDLTFCRRRQPCIVRAERKEGHTAVNMAQAVKAPLLYLVRATDDYTHFGIRESSKNETPPFFWPL